MKITLVHNDDAFPGGTRFLAGLKSGISGLGHVCETVLLDCGSNLDDDSIDAYVKTPKHASTRTRAFLGAFRLLTLLLKQEADAIIIWDAPWTVAIPALAVGRLLRIPVAFLCAEISYVGKAGFARRRERFTELGLYSLASVIFCVPGESRKLLTRVLRKPPDIVGIPSVSNLPSESGSRLATPERIEEHLGQPGKIIAYVGSAPAYSGVEDLWQALPTIISSFPDGRLLFIGPREAIPPHLRNSNAVVSPGWLSPEEVEGCLKQATIGVITAKDWEINRYKDPIKAYEYMKLGIPVVAPKIGGTLETVLSSGGGLLYNPGDYGDLAEKISFLLTHQRLRRNMGSRGRTYFTLNNSPKPVARRIIAALRAKAGYRRNAS